MRYDWFEVVDLDQLKAIDNNDENGSAWTVAYILQFANQFRFALEMLRIDSRRRARTLIGLPARTKEILFQTSFRFQF